MTWEAVVPPEVLGDLANVDEGSPSDGQALVFDDGTWVPGDAAALSDDDPAGLGETSPGTSGEASRSDHVHPLGPWTSFVMQSPDGSLFDVTIDNTGDLQTTGFDALLTEDGDLLTAEDGSILALEP